ncbi:MULTISPECIES: glycosyltransferase family 4 protein [Rhodococcus]|uniref:glycosyltransferase family 4 protein n=1 Tax=Rhodococcus TaxID=1827 RepID=UPI0002D23ACB|nr:MULTISPECIES: glycosyltransferase family 4 protein [Rhodococcus]CCW10915.1 glycosyltransferase-like protein [Rhodococcus aetherivorans]
MGSETMLRARPRVSIILPYLNSYRVPLLQVLDAKLAAKGIELDVATGTPEGVDVARGDGATGYPTRELRKLGVPTPRGRLYIRRLDDRIRTADIIVVEHAIKNLDSHVLLFRPRTTKVAIWGHGRTITKPQSVLENWAQRAMIARADWYFGYTPGSVERAAAMGMPTARCTNVQNTVDTERLKKLRREYPRGTGEVWPALYVGGLDESKRLDFLLDASRRIHARDPRFRLIIVGNGRDRDKVEAVAGEKWCSYLGNFPLAANFPAVKDANVILMPGRVGLAAVDSFAIEAPIVTTRWGWHAPEFEYLTDQNSIITDDRVEDYVDRVLDLMQSPNTLQDLQQQCANTVEQLSVEDMATRFTDGLVALLDSTRRACR